MLLRLGFGGAVWGCAFSFGSHLTSEMRISTPKLFLVSAVVLIVYGGILDVVLGVRGYMVMSHSNRLPPRWFVEHPILTTYTIAAAIFVVFAVVYAAYARVVHRQPLQSLATIHCIITAAGLMSLMAFFLLVPDRAHAANALVTAVAYSIVAAQLMFVVNLVVSAFVGQRT